jgi:hypothetical protein
MFVGEGTATVVVDVEYSIGALESGSACQMRDGTSRAHEARIVCARRHGLTCGRYRLSEGKCGMVSLTEAAKSQ